jgi:hypothetical protein
LVFENTENQLFVEASSSSHPVVDKGDPTSHQIEQVCELSDAVWAIERLQIDIPLEVHSKRWAREYSQSIDEAIDRGRAIAEQRFFEIGRGSITEDSEQRAERSEEGLNAYLTVEERPPEETTHEAVIRQVSKELRRKAKGKQVHWKYIGNTSARRECYVLVINGREDHRIP